MGQFKEKGLTFARKLAVESEPGLTNAQLLLTNHDLKPGRSFTRAQFTGAGS